MNVPCSDQESRTTGHITAELPAPSCLDAASWHFHSSAIGQTSVRISSFPALHPFCTWACTFPVSRFCLRSLAVDTVQTSETSGTCNSRTGAGGSALTLLRWTRHVQVLFNKYSIWNVTFSSYTLNTLYEVSLSRVTRSWCLIWFSWISEWAAIHTSDQYLKILEFRTIAESIHLYIYILCNCISGAENLLAQVRCMSSLKTQRKQQYSTQKHNFG